MNEEQHREPGAGLRILRSVINLARFLLTVLTIVAIPLIVIGLAGRGTITVAATLDEPYGVDFLDGRSVQVAAGGIREFHNFEIGREGEFLANVPEIDLMVEIQRDDLDSRLLAALSTAGLLAAAWIGLHNMSRIVNSAIGARPFADANPRRLRYLGAALLAVPLLDVAKAAALNRTLESDLPVTVSIGSAGLWALVVAGIGMFALAEVFEEAARLRRFEEATI